MEWDGISRGNRYSESGNNIQLSFATKTRWGDAIDQGWLAAIFYVCFSTHSPFYKLAEKLIDSLISKEVKKGLCNIKQPEPLNICWFSDYSFLQVMSCFRTPLQLKLAFLHLEKEKQSQLKSSNRHLWAFNSEEVQWLEKYWCWIVICTRMK